MAPLAPCLLLFGSVAAAQCEISATLDSAVSTPEMMAVRNAVYQKLCASVGGALVDADDLTVRSRLQHERRVTRLNFELTEDMSVQMRKSAPVVLAFIREPDGRVSWVTVLESSGDKKMDDLAVTLTTSMKYGVTKLDGQPVRLFTTVSQFGLPPKKKAPDKPLESSGGR